MEAHGEKEVIEYNNVHLSMVLIYFRQRGSDQVYERNLDVNFYFIYSNIYKNNILLNIIQTSQI